MSIEKGTVSPGKSRRTVPLCSIEYFLEAQHIISQVPDGWMYCTVDESAIMDMLNIEDGETILHINQAIGACSTVPSKFPYRTPGSRYFPVNHGAIAEPIAVADFPHKVKILPGDAAQLILSHFINGLHG